jgi:DNA-binding IscR family transcriptional regulator
MFRLSKKLLFAIEAVVDIAYNAGEEPVQSSEITRRQGIPRRYLEQVLQTLVRDGILTGVRGPLWMQLQEDCMRRLDSLSVDDLCREAQERGIEREKKETMDFSI